MSTETPSTDDLPTSKEDLLKAWHKVVGDNVPPPTSADVKAAATPTSDAPSQPPTVSGDDTVKPAGDDVIRAWQVIAKAVAGAAESTLPTSNGNGNGHAHHRHAPPPLATQPTMYARREALPLSSGSKRIKPGETATIMSRPQRPAFRPERFFVSGFEPAPTAIVVSPPPRRPWWKFWARRPNLQMFELQSAIATLHNELSEFRARKSQTCGAGDWEIHDITIGNKSQFAQAGALPGDMFSNLAIDSFVSFDTVETAMDICVTVTYRGPHKEGVPFSGGMLGTSHVRY